MAMHGAMPNSRPTPDSQLGLDFEKNTGGRNPLRRYHRLSSDQHHAAYPATHFHRDSEHFYTNHRVAKARTGNVPMPLILTGAAVKVNPLVGSPSRLHICSTIGIPAPNNTV
jgi:hypothetical protein